MYERFFRLRAAPFQLTPDASFFFGSRAHNYALSYLKFGVYQREGFIVVSGDVGTGKTTLVRMLIEGLDPRQVVAAHVTSTQLDSNELLMSICTAFGVAAPEGSKARALSALEAAFTAHAAAGRLALLVVDEAQNLGPRELEELRMLSNFQLGQRSLLQSFLVGQSELRETLRTPALEPLRQRIIASCHLQPLDEAETKAYIAHRLRRVGWDGRQIFSDAAITEIHRTSGGVPRKINLLCSRILLAAALEERRTVDLPDVQAVVEGMRAETGPVTSYDPPGAGLGAAGAAEIKLSSAESR